MGELLDLNSQIPDTRIPAGIARDAETIAAINAHLGATDPHPVYLTQTEGDARYRQSAVVLADGDIPAGITRDTETTAAINAHLGATDPHPIYLTQAEGDGRYSQIKSKLLTGTTLTTRTGSATVIHGLDLSKIVGFSAMIQMGVGFWLPFTGLDVAGEFVYTALTASAVVVNCGYTTNAQVLGKVFRILVFHID